MTQAKEAPAGPPAKGGLEGVVVAPTAMSTIDGEKGLLSYRGFDICDLAEHASFEETVHLLWYDRLPTADELHEFSADMAAGRAVVSEVLDAITPLAPRMSIMDLLRTGASCLAAYDPDARVTLDDPDAHAAANLRKASRVTAQMATLVAASHRLRVGDDPIAPRDDLSHAANFLYMLDGERPDEELARVLDVALVLHADHGFNASTFSARVTASTEADLHAAVTSAIGTLKGRLHGGANVRVMRMLRDIGSPDRAEAVVDEMLEKGQRVMGFGHRVYKVEDPRATVLRELARTSCERSGHAIWFDISQRVEEVMKERKPSIAPNVDFYSASTYAALGVPEDLFTAIFALSRVSGWIGHVMEQHRNNRLIRPRSDYVGQRDQAWVQIADR